MNFQPKNMSVEELETGLRWLFAEIYNEPEFDRRKRHYIDIVKQRLAAGRERPTLVAALGLEEARVKARDLADAARESARALGWGPEHRAGVFVEFVLSRQA